MYLISFNLNKKVNRSDIKLKKVLGVTVIMLFGMVVLFTILDPLGLFKEEYQEIIVEIDYDKPWVGTITNQGVMESLNGVATFSKVIQKPSNVARWSISASVQKLDSSMGLLTLRLKTSTGKVLYEASTFKPNDLIALSTNLS